MTLLKPTLKSQLNEYVPIKLSFSLTVIVFILNLALHFPFMWAYHRFKVNRKYLPSFLNHETTKLRPCLVVRSDDADEIHEIHKKWKHQFEILTIDENGLAVYNEQLSRRANTRSLSTKAASELPVISESHSSHIQSSSDL